MTQRSRWPRRGLGIVVAAAASAAAVALGGCSPDAATPTLTWYINPDNGGQARIAEACTDEAGGAYRISTSLLPNDAPGQREQLVRRLASEDSSIDIMSLDPVYVAEMAHADYLAPVPAQYEEEFTSGVIASSVESSTRRDELVAAPFWANTQLLWYRKSVAEAAGLDMSRPVTWDQVIDAAAGQGKRVSVQGIRAESLTVWLNALIESAGGHIVSNPDADSPDAVDLGLNSDAGRDAAAIMAKIGEAGVGGPQLSNQDENGSMLEFQSDDGGFMVNWPFVYAATKASVDEGALDAAVLDDMGWALYPRVDADTESRPPLGGINLGVGAFSEHRDLAFDAVQCIRTPEHQSEYFLTDGNAPSNLAAFDDPEVQREFPAAAEIAESLRISAPRPLTPYYNEVTGGVQKTWHPVTAADPETTPAASATLILEILRGERLL
ncbi:carbohydrate ABC transporter substrate-binding protein (CUT1 family) [Brevibacterium sanguinis]|uniref:Carbohydrate ABC transporter substrate-binding protein (CUT1 family) n=2 Tax=Brevibacterium TaxID=1696 RepID=A0A366IEV0_9MICO|nr:MULTISPECIES: extracellular solute-binding protein [Brevibacterium]RBP62371.1 carbohydrate ABC transporter substrate-binding protein (CUT1 family) [Brevibacterium sanguinis]RBP68760.1 carbohydrate ABC transporter substrate-binding protein (CUT1 family) [Brevibacterium celere]